MPDQADPADSTVDGNLMGECEALGYRSERVHQWLEPLLRSSPAARTAYAFKGRVKPASEIQAKVLGRRHHEEVAKRDPSYGPDRVSDASGFRFVKLFNSEVPEALDELLTFLNTIGNVGTRAADDAPRSGGAVREIEFHTSRRLEDPLSIYSQVRDVVEGKHRITLKPPAVGSSSYSSVHVVVDCGVVEGGQGRLIKACCEIQLRSVFEEAWSEISHRLKYAPIKSARGAGTPLTPDKTPNETWLHLDALKSLTDGCAQYADLINAQLRATALGPARRELFPGNKADELAAKFTSRGEHVLELAKTAYRMRETASKASRGAGAPEFLAAAEAFEVLEQALGDGAAPDLCLTAQEECAVCWIFSEDVEARIKAEKKLSDIVEAHPDRVRALMRLGQIRRDGGELAEAEKLLRRGLKAIGEGHGLEGDELRQANWLLRRDLAYVLWKVAQKASDSQQVAAPLREAVSISDECLRFALNDSQKLNTRLNRLYYVVDLWHALPADGRDVETARGVDLLMELRDIPDLSTWTTAQFDTLMHAELAFGDRDKANEAASVILRRLRGRQRDIQKARNIPAHEAFDQLSAVERKMFLRAQDTLVPLLDDEP